MVGDAMEVSVVADGTSELDVPHPESKSGTERRQPGRNGSFVRGAGLSPIRRAKGRSGASPMTSAATAARRAELAAAPTAYPRGCGRLPRPRGLAPSAPRQTLDGCAELPPLVDNLSSRIHPLERQGHQICMVTTRFAREIGR